MRSALAAVVALAALPSLAWAHGGAHAEPAAARAWDLITTATLIAAAVGYAIGWARMRAAARPPTPAAAVAYLAGLAIVAVALLSPLDRWSDVHFSAHMGQHELLVLFAAPLVVLGRPERVLRAALPRRARRRVSSALQRPGAITVVRVATNRWFAVVLHGAVVWAWHVPALFEAALANESVHALQHVMFFATAALFWWSMVRGRYGRLGYGIAVVFVFVTGLHKGLLGALLTIAQRPLYPTHAARTEAAGADATADQAFAGLLMWVPAGVIMGALGLGLFVAWLGALERRASPRGAGGR